MYLIKIVLYERLIYLLHQCMIIINDILFLLLCLLCSHFDWKLTRMIDICVCVYMYKVFKKIETLQYVFLYLRKLIERQHFAAASKITRFIMNARIYSGSLLNRGSKLTRETLSIYYSTFRLKQPHRISKIRHVFHILVV